MRIAGPTPRRGAGIGAALLTLLAALDAEAGPEGRGPTRSDGGLARTATAAAPRPDPGPDATIQRRLFVKRSRLHLRAGATYLAREDFWLSPGVTVDATYHPSEALGVELSSSVYFSVLEAGAASLRRQTGLLPDAEQPILRIAAGPRWSFAYGKIQLEAVEGPILHFDLGASLRLGGLLTDRRFNPGGDLALSAQLGLGRRWLAWIEISGWVSYEDRASGILHFGPAGSLGAGVRL